MLPQTEAAGQSLDVCGRARGSDRGTGGKHSPRPFPPAVVFGWLGLANYMLKRYGDAMRWSHEYASCQPDRQSPHLWLAAACAQLGQLEEARAEAAEVLRVNPGFTIESWKRLLVHKNPKDAEHRIDGARKAGLPET
jgi:adenylate cyclase